MTCEFARWRGRTVIACNAFENSRVPVEVATALAALTYRAAGSSPCASKSQRYVGPDAYLAIDAPERGA